MRYFFPFEAARFHAGIAPTLAAVWSARSFAPAQHLCRELVPTAQAFVQQTIIGQTEPLVVQIAQNKILFRKDLWRLLAGEVLLFGAEELPELETPLSTFAALLLQKITEDRPDFPLIQKVIEGTRDLCFGSAFYRPDHAGWNDLADVELLANWLSAVDTSSWRAEDLAEFGEEDRADELGFAQVWFAELVATYRRAAERRWVIVCEEL